MAGEIKNLVLQGSGIWGIAYLGVLDYMSRLSIAKDIRKVAGTSSGAIAACIMSFNLPFEEIKKISDTLDYSKIPGKENHPDLDVLPDNLKADLEKIIGDFNCFYRLVRNYGWFSSNYLYGWLKDQIAMQFNKAKKLPPYTFADFKNPAFHIDERPFLDLYVVGTNVSCRASQVFCYETTPLMEVAEAVRISMSIPLFFEAVKKINFFHPDFSPVLFSDGGIMRNYPINLFDYGGAAGMAAQGINNHTLGIRFKSCFKYHKIDSFPEFIENIFFSFIQAQQDIYEHSPHDIARSVEIEVNDISPVNFNIKLNDSFYSYLYRQGYEAARLFFSKKALNR